MVTGPPQAAANVRVTGPSLCVIVPVDDVLGGRHPSRTRRDLPVAGFHTTPPSAARIDVLSVPEKPVGEYSMPSIVTVE